MEEEEEARGEVWRGSCPTRSDGWGTAVGVWTLMRNEEWRPEPSRTPRQIYSNTQCASLPAPSLARVLLSDTLSFGPTRNALHPIIDIRLAAGTGQPRRTDL